MDESSEHRANGVSRSDYERAFAFVDGPARAKEIVDGMFARLDADPEHNIALDPKFIALLALFCDSGRALAAALMRPEDVRQFQQERAREYETVASAFPHLRTT